MPKQYLISEFVAKARKNFTEFYWLLDMNFKGTKYRFGDAPLIIPTDPAKKLYGDGISNIYFREGLIVKGTAVFDIDFNLWNRSARSTKIQVEITGHHQLQKMDTVFGFHGTEAELSLWQPGLYYEDRYVVI